MEASAAKSMSADREDGSAIVESIFGIFVLLFLTLGSIQVALSLYARNVVMSAVHDGARAAVEFGGSEVDATAAAHSAILRSAGSLVDHLEVAASTTTVSDRLHVRVTATGVVSAPGPIPVDVPVTFESTTTREVFGDRER